MEIHIKTIPHDTQRYPTVGDYWTSSAGVEEVRVSEMPDWRYEALVAVHELIEMILTKHRGIAEESRDNRERCQNLEVMRGAAEHRDCQ